MQTIDLTVNGEKVSATVDPRITLADFLRERVDARSVRLGCEHGVCGACTVVIDGKIARSCIAMVASLDGADVQTLEGFSNDPVIKQLRESFHRHHGLQCGFCTPGMLITARDIVNRGTATQGKNAVCDALAGNICRCTGYAGIIKAIQDAAICLGNSYSSDAAHRRFDD